MRQENHRLVTSKIENGNAVVFGVNVRLIQKLQMVKAICDSPNYATTTSQPSAHHVILFVLHWLPVKWRINYKLLLLCVTRSRARIQHGHNLVVQVYTSASASFC